MAKRRRPYRDPMRDEYSEYYEDEVRLEERRKKRDNTGKFQLPFSFIHLLIIACIGLLLLGLVWATGGGVVLEKTLQALVAPIGMIWIGLFLSTYFCLLYKQAFPAAISFASWILLTVCGNAFVASSMANALQSDYNEFSLAELKPLDVILVLGGGQATTPNGTAQTTWSGDRAVLAARIFKEGKTDRIICGGTSALPLAKGQLKQNDALQQILISLGVPEDKIIKIGGRNTSQEIQAFDKWIASNNAIKLRKGIVTSAWHMQRAQRLAKTVGINAEPLPADFSKSRVGQGPDRLIPSSANLVRTTAFMREYLAGLVGR